ncbi:polysaccharide biosynthesis/export family protein [Pontibacter vulgaris]|uniref:polysaccharide biosynthesis/export family protein n=1 Tax=Pontibacter vulgaris TaxID=2905679 RepID=UPI001FA7DE2A|nr:polysaccharide biosynthesis/export family protein [Pontibacter vulgaris]
MRIRLLTLFSLMFLFSCGKKNLAYFSDLGEKREYSENITNFSEPKIQPDDLLSISVSSLSSDANVLFNKGVITPVNSTNSSVNNQRYGEEGYLVDKNGFIEFPVLGKVKIGGLTKQEAKDKIVSELQNYLKRPTATIRFINFRVTVVGEVNKPATFTIPSEKINILEALGMAGDMTQFGKRDNVMIIREEGGVRKMARLNLNTTEAMNSPYFYLHQNDVIYVEPNKARVSQSTVDTRFISLGLAAISTLTLIVWRFF